MFETLFLFKSSCNDIVGKFEMSCHNCMQMSNNAWNLQIMFSKPPIIIFRLIMIKTSFNGIVGKFEMSTLYCVQMSNNAWNLPRSLRF